MAHQLASLPMRLGGLGLRSAVRMAPAAFWSSWADALHMIHERLPQLAADTVERLDGEHDVDGCLAELRNAADGLDRQGIVGRPSWVDLQAGARPPPTTLMEPGEWAHGWQFYASSASEHHFRKTVVLCQSCPSNQAHLRSHSGGGCSHVLHGCPTSPEYTLTPDVFRTIVLERLRLPLHVSDGRCDCRALTDSRGRHLAACPHSGRLQTRAVAPEKTLARICREAGATVRANVKLRDLNVAVRGDDERCIEVVASGLPLYHGAQLAVDITMRSAVTSSDEARPGADRVDGIVCINARADKEQKYAELLAGDRCRLIFVALGGRWSPEALEFIEGLARARAREAPPNQARSAFLAWRRRWTRLLSVSCAKAFATSLLFGPGVLHAVCGADGGVPDATDLYGAA